MRADGHLAHLAPFAPCAMAIGGLDPGGGAGVAADLRAFDAAGVFGCPVVSVLTVQSTAGVRSVRAVAPGTVVAQAEEVLAHQRVRAIKVGALGSAENVRAVARVLARHPDVPAVVDTPLRPTRGKGRLTAGRAVSVLRDVLLPCACLVTANLDETAALLGTRPLTVGDARDAALALCAIGPRAALVKGGHMEGADAVDVLAVDGAVIELRARRLAVGPVHGTGCAFAALVAGRIARRPRGRLDRSTLVASVRWAKRVHRAALGRAVAIGDGQRVMVFR